MQICIHTHTQSCLKYLFPPTDQSNYKPEVPQANPTAPGYATRPGPMTTPGFGMPMTTPGYATRPGPTTAPGYGTGPKHTTAPGYGTGPQHTTAPGYGTGPQHTTAPGYGTEPGYSAPVVPADDERYVSH